MDDVLERKFVGLKFKADDVGSDGAIEGYASRFGQVDDGGDIVEAGAYAAALAGLSAEGRRVKMLWQHDPSQPIGVWDEITEDATGLRVKGRILSDLDKGRETLTLIKAGAIDGLSIGYRTVRAEKLTTGERLLKELELWEVSVVTFPMQKTARIDGAKAAAMTRIDLERVLTHDAKMTRSAARALMSGGHDAIKAMHDAGDGIGELADLLRVRCNIGRA